MHFSHSPLSPLANTDLFFKKLFCSNTAFSAASQAIGMPFIELSLSVRECIVTSENNNSLNSCLNSVKEVFILVTLSKTEAQKLKFFSWEHSYLPQLGSVGSVTFQVSLGTTVFLLFCFKKLFKIFFHFWITLLWAFRSISSVAQPPLSCDVWLPVIV